MWHMRNGINVNGIFLYMVYKVKVSVYHSFPEAHHYASVDKLIDCVTI